MAGGVAPGLVHSMAGRKGLRPPPQPQPQPQPQRCPQPHPSEHGPLGSETAFPSACSLGGRGPGSCSGAGGGESKDTGVLVAAQSGCRKEVLVRRRSWAVGDTPVVEDGPHGHGHLATRGVWSPPAVTKLRHFVCSPSHGAVGCLRYGEGVGGGMQMDGG
ncbi:unnamed protein product, partial [Discosporangium mesarthrocarpum]